MWSVQKTSSHFPFLYGASHSAWGDVQLSCNIIVGDLVFMEHDDLFSFFRGEIRYVGPHSVFYVEEEGKNN